MGVALILGGLALTCLGIFGWLWLAGGVLRPGWRGILGALALQLSALCLVYGMIRGQPLNGLFLAMFPPLAVTEAVRAAPFLPFLTDVARSTAPYAGAVLLVSLAVPRLRRWALGLTLTSALIAAGVVGDRVSLNAMCQAAATRGITSFARNSFFWSLANAPREWQWEIHARAEVNGTPLGWSYRSLGWYAIPARASDEVTGAVVTCP